MTIKSFRGVDFINRDKEISFFLDYFKNKPERVMWVYGPKSTGKTTLIEYIIEEKLTSGLKVFDKYWIKYINLRGMMVGSYNSFINSFFEKVPSDDFANEIKAGFDIGIFKLEAKVLEQIKNKEKNLFHELIVKLKKIKKNKIIVIDEIQTLQDIYHNGEKELLNEFLNFCVRLTKETHLSHVLILTSNTIFLNQIYNNAKMKATSDFKLIDHLPYSEIETWLTSKDLGFGLKDVELIYDYLGGSVAHIKKLIDFKKEYNSLKEQLEEMAEIAKNEIILFFEQQKISKEEREKFLFVAKKIVEDGKFINGDYEGYLEIVSKFAEVEILFFDPIKNIATANSRIYVKAFERI